MLRARWTSELVHLTSYEELQVLKGIFFFKLKGGFDKVNNLEQNGSSEPPETGSTARALVFRRKPEFSNSLTGWLDQSLVESGPNQLPD